MNFLKQFFQKLWNDVVKPEGEAAIASFEAKVTPDVYKLAEDAVTAAASLGGGAASRDAAVAQLKTDLVTAGHDITTWAENELNALVELAYLAVKPTLPAAKS